MVQPQSTTQQINQSTLTPRIPKGNSFQILEKLPAHHFYIPLLLNNLETGIGLESKDAEVKEYKNEKHQYPIKLSFGNPWL
ncbi:MAG: hypothetical protein JST75_13315 [Bacteroidetes bacterium]|nr:hypothetical protein [Bacteroidota bacterium]